MTRHFTRASSQSFNVSCTPPVAPYTLACWFRSDALVGIGGLMVVDGATGYDLVYVSSGGVLTDQVSANANNSTISGVVQDKWHSGALVCSATNSRVVYLDGKPGTTNTDAEATTKNSLQIGTYGSNYWNGIIATPAIWNCALSPAEVRALAAGVHPNRIRPSNLWMPPGNFDASRAGGPVMQPRGAAAFAFTDNGSVGISNNTPPVGPEVIRRRIFTSLPASGRTTSFALTEANDAAAMVALHGGSALINVTESADTMAFSASVRHQASFAMTEAADIAAMAAMSGNVSLKIPVIAPYKSDDTIGTKTLQVYQFSGGSLVAVGGPQTTGFTAIPNITNGWMVTIPVNANGPVGDFYGLAVFSNITPSSGSQNARAVPLYSPPRSFPSTLKIVVVKQFDDSVTIVTPGYQLYDVDRNADGSHVTAGIVAPAGTSKCYAALITRTPDAQGGSLNFIEWDSG